MVRLPLTSPFRFCSVDANHTINRTNNNGNNSNSDSNTPTDQKRDLIDDDTSIETRIRQHMSLNLGRPVAPLSSLELVAARPSSMPKPTPVPAPQQQQQQQQQRQPPPSPPQSQSQSPLLLSSGRLRRRKQPIVDDNEDDLAKPRQPTLRTGSPPTGDKDGSTFTVTASTRASTANQTTTETATKTTTTTTTTTIRNSNGISSNNIKEDYEDATVALLTAAESNGTAPPALLDSSNSNDSSSSDHLQQQQQQEQQRGHQSSLHLARLPVPRQPSCGGHEVDPPGNRPSRSAAAGHNNHNTISDSESSLLRGAERRRDPMASAVHQTPPAVRHALHLEAARPEFTSLSKQQHQQQPDESKQQMDEITSWPVRARPRCPDPGCCHVAMALPQPVPSMAPPAAPVVMAKAPETPQLEPLSQQRGAYFGANNSTRKLDCCNNDTISPNVIHSDNTSLTQRVNSDRNKNTTVCLASWSKKRVDNNNVHRRPSLSLYPSVSGTMSSACSISSSFADVRWSMLDSSDDVAPAVVTTLNASSRRSSKAGGMMEQLPQQEQQPQLQQQREEPHRRDGESSTWVSRYASKASVSLQTSAARDTRNDPSTISKERTASPSLEQRKREILFLSRNNSSPLQGGYHDDLGPGVIATEDESDSNIPHGSTIAGSTDSDLAEFLASDNWNTVHDDNENKNSNSNTSLVQQQEEILRRIQQQQLPQRQQEQSRVVGALWCDEYNAIRDTGVFTDIHTNQNDSQSSTDQDNIHLISGRTFQGSLQQRRLNTASRLQHPPQQAFHFLSDEQVEQRRLDEGVQLVQCLACQSSLLISNRAHMVFCPTCATVAPAHLLPLMMTAEKVAATSNHSNEAEQNSNKKL